MGHPSVKSRGSIAPEELTSYVKMAQSGDDAAFSVLIDATQERLFRFFCYLTPSRQLAEDLCQDTYVRALESLKKLKTPENFVGWLFKTGRNLFLDHVRLHKNTRNVSLTQLPEGADAETPIRADSDLDIRKALEGLEPEERVVLVLVDAEAYSYQEAAEIIGVSEAALRSRVHRARKAFLERYSR